MATQTNKKTALITGANKGIGKLMLDAQAAFQVPIVFAGLLVLAPWLSLVPLVALSAILLVQLLLVLEPLQTTAPIGTTVIDAKQVGIALFGPYLLAVELASTLLLAGLVAAYHLGRQDD